MKLSVNLSYVMVVNWANSRAVALLAWLPCPLFQGQYYFQTCCKKDDKNQKFLRKFFACFNVKLEALIRCRRHFSICNIKGVEKISITFQSIYFRCPCPRGEVIHEWSLGSFLGLFLFQWYFCNLRILFLLKLKDSQCLDTFLFNFLIIYVYTLGVYL